MPGPEQRTTGLTRTLKKTFTMREEEVNALADSLFQARKRAWVTALEDQAGQFGYKVSAHAPRREDLAMLRQMSDTDARSIAETWRKDVSKRIDKLFNDNPRGNRYYYRKGIDEWNTEREKWKANQIARQTETTTYAYAQERFLEQNGLTTGLFLFTGPPPVCPICQQLYADGPQPYEVVRKYRTPLHVGCTHVWEPILSTFVGRPRPADLWIG